MRWTVYILLCDRKTYYVGITTDIKNRLIEHRTKKSFYTKRFSEIELVYVEERRTEADAKLRELQLKGWSNAKKKALIEANLRLLSELSKSTKRVEV